MKEIEEERIVLLCVRVYAVTDGLLQLLFPLVL